MGDNNRKVATGSEIAAELKRLKESLKDDTIPEEIQQINQEKNNKTWKDDEFERRKNKLLDFLINFRCDSDIFFNNFFRKRKTESFSYNEIHGYRMMLDLLRNIYDERNDKVIVHYRVDINTILELINLAIMIQLSKPLEEDTIFYRGCVSMEENGVNGIVSVTSDKKIAEQYSEGTILSIVVPKGTRILDAGAIWKEKGGESDDFNKTFILPPCYPVVLSEEEKEKGNEPKNPRPTTKHLKVEVTPLDLLEEFMKVLNDPPENYDFVRMIEERYYNNAVLEHQKDPSNKYYKDRVEAGNYEQTVAFLKEHLARRNQRISKGIKIYSKTNDTII